MPLPPGRIARSTYVPAVVPRRTTRGAAPGRADSWGVYAATLIHLRMLPIGVMLVVWIVVALPSAYTAPVDAPARAVGLGTGRVSGFEISRVQYRLNPADTAQLDAVEFDLDRPAREVAASSGQLRLSCIVSGLHVVCWPATDVMPVTGAGELRVTAVS